MVGARRRRRRGNPPAAASIAAQARPRAPRANLALPVHLYWPYRRFRPGVASRRPSCAPRGPLLAAMRTRGRLGRPTPRRARLRATRPNHPDLLLDERRITGARSTRRVAAPTAAGKVRRRARRHRRPRRARPRSPAAQQGARGFFFVVKKAHQAGRWIARKAGAGAARAAFSAKERAPPARARRATHRHCSCRGALGLPVRHARLRGASSSGAASPGERGPSAAAAAMPVCNLCGKSVRKGGFKFHNSVECSGVGPGEARPGLAQCPACGARVKPSRLAQHRATKCAGRPPAPAARGPDRSHVTCDMCGATVRAANIDAHRQHKCPARDGGAAAAAAVGAAAALGAAGAGALDGHDSRELTVLASSEDLAPLRVSAMEVMSEAQLICFAARGRVFLADGNLTTLHTLDLNGDVTALGSFGCWLFVGFYAPVAPIPERPSGQHLVNVGQVVGFDVSAVAAVANGTAEPPPSGFSDTACPAVAFHVSPLGAHYHVPASCLHARTGKRNRYVRAQAPGHSVVCSGWPSRSINCNSVFRWKRWRRESMGHERRRSSLCACVCAYESSCSPDLLLARSARCRCDLLCRVG